MSHSSNNICILAADNWIGVSIVQEIMRKSTPGREPPHREVSDVSKVYCGVFNARNRRSVELATLGAELVEISPQNESQWSHILKYVKGVIIVPPMENRPAFEEDMCCILECIKKANVQAAVLISSVGVELHSGHGGSRHEEQYFMRIFEKLKRIEQTFQQTGQKGHWNIVRLSLAQQMLLQFSRLIQESGQLMLPSKEGKCAFVNLNDVAHCVCKLITNPQQRAEPGHGQPGQPGQAHAYKLTGPEPLDGRRIVDQMNQNAEADVKFQNVDLNITERYLRYELGEQGLALAHYITGMLIFMQQGKLDFKTDDIKKLCGKEATKIGTFFKEYAQLFKP